METPEAWANLAFLRALEPYAVGNDYYGPSELNNAVKIDLNGRWRKLLPLFVDPYVDQTARIDSESTDFFEDVHFVSRADDAENVRDAITIINFARGEACPSKCLGLIGAIMRRQVSSRGLHGVLKKRTTSAERIAILLELAKMERLEPDQRFMGRGRYTEVLGNELEATPSPLTSASDLPRLGLPSL